MRFDPASAPGTNRAICGANRQGNLLIALLGMGMGGQNNSSPHGERLWRRVGSDELLKVLSVFSGQCNWISGFGTSHGLSPPTPSLSSLIHLVKLGKYL